MSYEIGWARLERPDPLQDLIFVDDLVRQLMGAKRDSAEGYFEPFDDHPGYPFCDVGPERFIAERQVFDALGRHDLEPVRVTWDGGVPVCRRLRPIEYVADTLDLRQFLRRIRDRVEGSLYFTHASVRKVWPDFACIAKVSPPNENISARQDKTRRRPGRPPIIGPVMEEAKRRLASGEVLPSKRGLAQFARDLVAWWEKERQQLPRLADRTIANEIRPLWKEALKTSANRF